MEEESEDAKSETEVTIEDIVTSMAEYDKTDSGLDVWEIRDLLVQKGFPKKELNIVKLRKLLSLGISEDRLNKMDANESTQEKKTTSDEEASIKKNKKSENVNKKGTNKRRSLKKDPIVKSTSRKRKTNYSPQNKASSGGKDEKVTRTIVKRRNSSSHRNEEDQTTSNRKGELKSDFIKFTTKGDGRCLFRSVTILLNPDLQVERKNGILEDRRLMLKETCTADSLRLQVVRYCLDNYESLSEELTGDALSSDLPSGSTFTSFIERLESISNATSTVGEFEVNVLSKVLRRCILITDKFSGNVTCYGGHFTEMPPLRVLFSSLGDGLGHYEALKEI